MKVLYVVRYPQDRSFSIQQKIDGQILGMREMGCEVSFLSFDNAYMYLNEEGRTIKQWKLSSPNSRLYYHYRSYVDLYRNAKKAINEGSFDIIYFRSAPLNKTAIGFFNVASQKSKIVVEIPTYSKHGREKPQSLLRKMYSYYSDILWKRCARKVALFALIGEEEQELFGRPAINIDNAVTIQGIPIKQNEKAEDGKTHIIAVASMSEWHGYDRLILGLSNWKKEKKNDYVIDMVGDEGDGSLAKWKRLVVEKGLEKSVIFHGKKTGDELTDLFNRSTIGVSSLGFYKVGFSTGSVLKLREYMARGLPFIYAHDDPDLKPDMEWCLKIPNNSSPVDMDLVDSFVERIKNTKDISIQMRSYAKENMTWTQQFRKVFSRLNEEIND